MVKCWRDVLWRSVVKECCEKGGERVLWRSDVKECC